VHRARVLPQIALVTGRPSVAPERSRSRPGRRAPIEEASVTSTVDTAEEPSTVDAVTGDGAPPAGDDVPPRAGLARRWAAVRATGEAGMSTAEYAVGTVAACAFAAVLYRVVTGGSIVTGLTDLVESALATLS
jgi:hypothetical protein